MIFVRGLLRLLAFAFNIAVGFFLFGIGFISSIAGENIHFPLVPFSEGETLKWTLIGMGLFAIIVTLLSLMPSKIMRFLMLLWNLLVVGLLINAGIGKGYRFRGEEHFQHGLILFAVAVLALWGSWAQLRASSHRLSV